MLTVLWVGHLRPRIVQGDVGNLNELRPSSRCMVSYGDKQYGTEDEILVG